MGWRQSVAKYVRAFGGFLTGKDMDAVERLPKPGLADAVNDARQQWQAARAFFDDVTDPRLIDYAIFAIGAAEKRYMYLLDEARRQGVAAYPLGEGRADAGAGELKSASEPTRPRRVVPMRR